MRILLVASYPPPYGGVATYVESLAGLLQDAGHECLVLASLRPGHQYPPNVAPLGELPPRLRSFRPDVVHDVGRLTIRPAFDREEALAMLVLLGWGSRVLVSLHHGGVSAQLRASSHLRRWVTKWKCSLVAHFMADTADIQKAILSLGVPAHKISVVSPHLPIMRRDVPIRPSIAQFLDSHHPVLGTCMWRLVPYYGFDLTLAVVGDLRKTYPDIGVFVALGSKDGDPAYVREIMPTIEREGLASHVHFSTEEVGRDEFLCIMAHFDAFVRPSFVDADSLSVREGLHLGVPVVASDADRRPRGTTVFRSGEWQDFRDKVAAVLRSGRDRSSAAGWLEADGLANFGRIVEVYRVVSERARALL